MNRIIIPIIFAAVLLASCTTTGQGTDYANDAKLISPTAMVAPTDNPEARDAYNKGSQLMNAGKYNEAEPYLLKAVELDPKFVDAMDHLGIVYRRQKRYEDAEKIYLRSLSINDRNSVPYVNLGLVYRNLNRFDDSLRMYAKLIEIEPDNPEGYYGAGELFLMAQDYENSIACFKTAEELYTKQKSVLVYDAYYYLGFNYYYLEDYDEALRYLELARQYHKNNQQLENLIKDIKNRK